MSSANDESYICRLCSKGFASSVALENHFRYQHFDTYSQGETDKWYGGIIVGAAASPDSPVPDGRSSPKKASLTLQAVPSPVPDGRSSPKKASLTLQAVPSPVPDDRSSPKPSLSDLKKTELQREAVLSSMSQAPITALASIDVSMIIFKEEDDDISPAVRKRVKKKKGRRTRIELENANICSECGKQYLVKSKLMYHIRKAHKIMLDNAICDVCGEAFKTKSSLKRHITVHNKEHCCPECPETFSKYSSLKKHYLDHSEKRQYVCDICKGVLNAKSELDEHYSTVHSLTKPYQCDVCERTFNQEHSLKVHMNASHKASSTYTCKFCSNIFNDPELLTIHENKSHRKRKRTPESNHYEQQGDVES